VKEVSAISN